MNAKVEEIVNKAKTAAKAGYDKGNDYMDKVPALKSKRNKLIVWGVLAVIVLLIFKAMFMGGAADPFDVVRNTMMATVSGDIETILENVYFNDETKGQIAQLSDSEARALETEIVNQFVAAYEGVSDEQRKLMRNLFSSMKCKKTEINGKEAHVTVSVKSVEGEESEKTFTLVNDGGDWKLDFSRSMN